MQKIQGWSELGNTVVSVSGLNSSSKVQGSFPLATITVYLHGTITLASIFSDNNISPTPLANPFTANANGTFGFYVNNGHYDIVLSGAGIPSPLTISDVFVNDAASAFYNALEYGAKGNSSTNDSGALNTLANTTIPATGGTIYFPPATYLIGTNLTFPSNVNLMVDDGAKFSVSTGITLTINGPISAGLWQLFSGVGTVTIQNGDVVEVSWFGWTTGTNSSGVRTANSTALTSAISALSPNQNGGTIMFPIGAGYVNTGITMPSTTINLTFLGRVPCRGTGLGTSDLAVNKCSRLGFVGSGTGINASDGGSNTLTGVKFVNLVIGYAGIEDNTQGTVPDYILKISGEGMIAGCLIHGARLSCIANNGLLTDYTILDSTIGVTDFNKADSAGDCVRLTYNSGAWSVDVFSMYRCYNFKANRGLYAEICHNGSFRDTVFESMQNELVKLYWPGASFTNGLSLLKFDEVHFEAGQLSQNSGNHYYVVLDAATASTTGAQAVTFDSCWFSDTANSYQQLIDVNVGRNILFRNCSGFYDSSTAQAEVAIGSSGVTGIVFDHCSYLTSQASFIDGNIVVLVRDGGYSDSVPKDQGQYFQNFDADSPGSWTWPIGTFSIASSTANHTDVFYLSPSTNAIYQWRAPKSGSVLALTITADGNTTSAGMTVSVAKNGTTGLSVAITSGASNWSNTQYKTTSGNSHFSAGDLITLQYTTTVGWTSTTTKFQAWVLVEM